MPGQYGGSGAATSGYDFQPLPNTRLEIPAGALSVQFLGVPETLRSVAVYNSIGQLIARKDASAVNSQNRIEFNVADEPNDVYFVKIFYTDHVVVKKIVKIK